MRGLNAYAHARTWPFCPDVSAQSLCLTGSKRSSMCTQADERAVAAIVAPDARVLLVLEALHRESAVLVHLTQARACN